MILWTDVAKIPPLDERLLFSIDDRCFFGRVRMTDYALNDVYEVINDHDGSVEFNSLGIDWNNAGYTTINNFKDGAVAHHAIKPTC
jgi:hypothetical protein